MSKGKAREIGLITFYFNDGDTTTISSRDKNTAYRIAKAMTKMFSQVHLPHISLPGEINRRRTTEHFKHTDTSGFRTP